jgi:hypothetical protein
MPEQQLQMMIFSESVTFSMIQELKNGGWSTDQAHQILREYQLK